MTRAAFSHVRQWVFDLDNTLYPPAARLFDQIETRMVDYIVTTLAIDRGRAEHLRKHYWATYGTTLAGLMREHQIDPAPYLTQVHDISFDHLEPDPYLCETIARLPGRKIVYTNGTAPYAAHVLKARGLEAAFDAIYGVEEAGFLPKPERGAFEKIFATDGITPASAAMFEDDPRNLAVPHALGMRTVHVAPDLLEAPHIHHHTNDLSAFLARLT
jgi:putative hydrolase of the HAD superfamily